MRINLLILFILLLCASSCHKTEGDVHNISLDLTEYDFGTIADSVIEVSHKFKIINNTDDTCHINKVIKSCGCTKVEFEETLILPHSNLTFDVTAEIPKGYSFFEKEISIFTDLTQKPLELYIRAHREIPQGSLSREFPVKINDDIRISTPYLIVGNIEHGQSRSKAFDIVNTSDNPIKINANILNGDQFIDVAYDEVIQSHDVSRVVVWFDLSQCKDIWGLKKYDLQLNVGSDTLILPIEAIFIGKVDLNKENPRISVKCPHYTIDLNQRNSVKFEIFNLGKEDLVIHNISYPDSMIRLNVNNKTILPGDSAIITATVLKPNKGVSEIGLSTNDPIEPFKILRITCIGQ